MRNPLGPLGRLVPAALSTTRGFRALAFANLAFLWVIVPSGAAVRLTGSGLGCPEWPLCDEGGIVPANGAHGVIEFSNRVFSAVVMVSTILTWLVARRLAGRPRTPRRLALAAMLMSVGQIPLGGLTVLTDLHPLMVSSHFLLSMAALAVATVLAVTAADLHAGRVRGWSPRRGPFSVATVVALGAVIVTGVLVTAAGPHSGDAEVIDRYGELQDAAWIHVRAVAVLLVLVAVLIAWVLRDPPVDRAARPLLGLAAVLLVAQVTIGEIQYRAGLPWGVVLVHVTLAGVLWVVGVAATTVVARPPVAVADALPGAPLSEPAVPVSA